MAVTLRKLIQDLANTMIRLGIVKYGTPAPEMNMEHRHRKCAGMNEILVDDRTRELARQEQGAVLLRANRALTLKGFDAPVVSFAL